MRSTRPREPTGNDARFAPVLRIAAFVLAALVLGLLVLFGAVWLESQRLKPPRDYFPEGALEAADEMRIGRLLAEMDEPVLAASDDDGQFALRMLYAPSWGDPVAVRYQATRDGALRRSVVLDDPATDTARQRIAVARETSVSSDELQNLRHRLEQSGFWHLPPTDEANIKDGYALLVEAVDGDRHWLLTRSAPNSQSSERGLDALVGLMADELNRDDETVLMRDADDWSP
ncbi:hypothetical protein [Marilutibacter chinensis]|uniref:Secreted protein n=1 Tax=Marilutibacter chinensis TaxID=2912247 RepID=A0ABS9HRL4_9GAMM|nr:hypothetical protein [Lysobacter chinensis]MCF7221575.1 hypothetical protein [Lysobacter chinensis]